MLMKRFVLKYLNKAIIEIKKKMSLAKLPSLDRKLISQIREQNLTYLPGNKLASIALSCRTIENQNLPGMFIEAGCALGRIFYFDLFMQKYKSALCHL